MNQRLIARTPAAGNNEKYRVSYQSSVNAEIAASKAEISPRVIAGGSRENADLS